ncbi:MAG: potassium-transporting ATPase subunit KdpB, partial [Hyphomicrobium sp.]|nr:potassium-transporting ATPase subunit KdpB [Hyphomicrobium sp.]
MPRKRYQAASFDRTLVLRAVADAFRKLDPRVLVRNPVIFVTAVVSALVTVLFVRDLITGQQAGFSGQIAAWLWFTVLFANFAEAIAEGRGRAQADALRRARTDATAKRLADPKNHQRYDTVSALDLRPGDTVLVVAGELIPGDGDIIEGVASVNEAAVTGESAPVIREAGGDRSAVTGGTTVLSDWIVVRITSAPGSSFLDRMIALVEGAERQKTPNEIALNILLAGMTIVFLVAVVTLTGLGAYSGTTIAVTVLVALLVTLIPTTIGGLLSAIGIAGMDRLLQFNVLAMSGRAVEAAGDVDTLLLDKTGTITFGNRMATEVIPVPGVSEREAADAALLASLADETPEGRSIVTLTQEKYRAAMPASPPQSGFVEFSATTRLSGVDFDGRKLRKGAVDAVLKFANAAGNGGGDAGPPAFRAAVERIARSGGTPLGLADGGKLLGVIHLKDVVKPDIKERFAQLRRMGIKTVMITGDNPVTAAAIASEAGVDDFVAEATPEDKLRYIRDEQAQG